MQLDALDIESTQSSDQEEIEKQRQKLNNDNEDVLFELHPIPDRLKQHAFMFRARGYQTISEAINALPLGFKTPIRRAAIELARHVTDFKNRGLFDNFVEKAPEQKMLVLNSLVAEFNTNTSKNNSRG